MTQQRRSADAVAVTSRHRFESPLNTGRRAGDKADSQERAKWRVGLASDTPRLRQEPDPTEFHGADPRIHADCANSAFGDERRDGNPCHPSIMPGAGARIVRMTATWAALVLCGSFVSADDWRTATTPETWGSYRSPADGDAYR